MDTASERPDHVQKHTMMPEAHIREVFREAREVVPESRLHVLTYVPVKPDQNTPALLVEIRHRENPALEHSLPMLPEVPVRAQDVELCPVIEELWVLPVEAQLSEAVGVFSADRPVLGEIVVDIQRRDMALLNVLCGRILQC